MVTRVYETHNARVSVSGLRLSRCNLKTDRFRPYYASFVLGGVEGGGAIFVNVVVGVISSFVCVYESFVTFSTTTNTISCELALILFMNL